MTNIKFSAFLIKFNESSALNVAYVGIAAFVVAIFLCGFSATQSIGIPVLIGGVIAILIGLIANKGRGYEEVDTNNAIRFNDDGIEIRSVFYSYAEITDLDFYFHSYYSQSSISYATENAGMIELGMNNRISFKKNGTEVREFFFLGKQSHANMFFDLLKTLKARNILYSFSNRRQVRW